MRRGMVSSDEQWSLSVKPKHELTAFQVKLFSSLQMLGYMVLQSAEQ